MQSLRPLLLEVWREACRHIEIQESIATILGRLAPQLPIAGILIRQLDVEPASVVTIASAQTSPRSTLGAHRRPLSARQWSRLVNWCQRGRLFGEGRGATGILKLVLPPDVGENVLALPLAGDDGAVGVALFVPRSGERFTADQLRLVEMLREPFSVALQNDRRLREMTKLRASAEAERGALLRRLGRTDLGETIVGEHGGLREVVKRVMLVVHSDVPVLILGETGTGKEVIARALHARSSRQQGPFIRVNCGAIPSELIDSQLFGHEKGSFTGAAEARAGWFERADGGTLFLDEIGELPLNAQVRFLRVLQDGFVERVGGANPVHVDVRVVAATHRDLATMVREREFREDLWYRLAVFPILLPPLRDRPDDIPELAQHFTERAAVRFGLAPVTPSPEEIRLLQSYDWPGNIRELGAVIDRAVILGEGSRLEVATALGWNAAGVADGQPPPVRPARAVDFTGAAPVPSLDEAMRRHIQAVLEMTRGRVEGRAGAAAMLKINPHTLRARMRKLGIDWSRYRVK